MTQQSILNDYLSLVGLVNRSATKNQIQFREQSPVTIREYSRDIPAGNDSMLTLALKRLVDGSDGLIENIIVHGSAGDYTTVSFSDLDATIVISDKTVKSSHELLRLQHYMHRAVLPFLYTYDNSQHHGFFFLWPSLCENYDEAILPPCVYDRAWAVNPIILSIRTEHNSSMGRTSALITQILNSLGKNSSWTKYTFKNLLSHLLILPSVFATEQGNSAIKPESFTPFIQVFPEYKLVYEFASEQRLKWRHDHKYSVTPIHQLAWRVLSHRYPKVMAYRYPLHYMETSVLDNIRYSLESILYKGIDE